MPTTPFGSDGRWRPGRTTAQLARSWLAPTVNCWLPSSPRSSSAPVSGARPAPRHPGSAARPAARRAVGLPEPGRTRSGTRRQSSRARPVGPLLRAEEAVAPPRHGRGDRGRHRDDAARLGGRPASIAALREAVGRRRARLADLRRRRGPDPRDRPRDEGPRMRTRPRRGGRVPQAQRRRDAADPERAYEEERRLAYVAWTRARRSLTLVYDPGRPRHSCSRRSIPGSWRPSIRAPDAYR